MQLQALRDVSSEQHKNKERNKHEFPAERKKNTIHVVHADDADQRRLCLTTTTRFHSLSSLPLQFDDGPTQDWTSQSD